MNDGVTNGNGATSGSSFWGGANRDQVTKAHFNGLLTVTGHDSPTVLERSLALFGREMTADDWKELAGAPDHHNVRVKNVGPSLEIRIENGEFFKKLVVSRVHQGEEDLTACPCYLEMDAVFTSDVAPARLAPRMLFYICKKCSSLGIDLISLEAAGYKDHPARYTGYLRWPQLGFDADLLEAEINDLPPQFAGSETVGDIYDQPGGFDFWVEHGMGRRMDFDLLPASRSQAVLAKYLSDRGIVIS